MSQIIYIWKDWLLTDILKVNLIMSNIEIKKLHIIFKFHRDIIFLNFIFLTNSENF